MESNKEPLFKSKRTWIFLCILVFSIVWIRSFLNTNNSTNWMLENILVVVFLLILIFTFRKFQFSLLSYFLICLFMCLHVYGSQYSYSENPIGYYFQDIFNFSRNHYDRLVHFSFGLLLTLPIQEMFRKSLENKKWMMWLMPILFILSISALYEIVEWMIADLFYPEQGMAFLGIQGDVWDAQKDTALAFAGAFLASTAFSLINNRNGQ